MFLNCGIRENSWESLGLQGDPTSPSKRKSILNIHWKDWCWSWSSNALATWCKELTHWKRPWCWERLKVGREEGNRGWDGWMASPTRWMWVWATPGVGDGQGTLAYCIPWGCEELDRTEWLNWTELLWLCPVTFPHTVPPPRKLSFSIQSLLVSLIQFNYPFLQKLFPV